MNTILLRPTDDGCAREIDGLRGSYVNGKVIAAVLDLARWPVFADYEKDVLKKSKGVWSDGTRARKRGYTVREYAHRAWLEDVAVIEASKPVRCGGPMRAAYLRSVEERGGVDPTATVTPPRCQRHWRQTWGVFGNRDRHVWDSPHSFSTYSDPDRLVGFASLVRSDELVIYSMFICHGDHLKDGIAHLLHAEIVKHLMTGQVSESPRFVMYGALQDGGVGLRAWKTRLAFEGVRLVALPCASLSSSPSP